MDTYSSPTRTFRAPLLHRAASPSPGTSSASGCWASTANSEGGAGSASTVETRTVATGLPLGSVKSHRRKSSASEAVGVSSSSPVTFVTSAADASEPASGVGPTGMADTGADAVTAPGAVVVLVAEPSPEHAVSSTGTHAIAPHHRWRRIQRL